MEPQIATISARSRRQAMDWSLVLASQDIETTIEPPSQEAGWRLIVDAAQLAQAQEAIRLYEFENPQWPWQQKLLLPGLLFDWASITWALLLGLFALLMQGRPNLEGVAVMNTLAVGRGQWWRLFSAIWLHADAAHLAGNAGMGVILLGLTMGRYGTGLGLLAAYLCGVSGNLAVWLLASSPHQSLGASGMVMGALGLLAVQSVTLWRHSPRGRKFLLGSIMGGVLLLIFLGTSPGTDIVAHVGGFVCGLILGSLMTLARDLPQRRSLNFIAGVAFGLLVLWPWWQVLRHA